MIVDPSDVIHLDVGGRSFTTSKRTLVRAGALYNCLASWQQEDAIVIDRDPQHFGAVLAFLRNGNCSLPDTTASLLALRVEAEAYQVSGLVRMIDSSTSMRVHCRLAAAAHESRALLQAAAEALLAYAFGRLPLLRKSTASTMLPGGNLATEDILSSGFDAIELNDSDVVESESLRDATPADLQAWPGLMADTVDVDVRVAVSTSATVQGRYSCYLDASICGPAAIKQLRHQYEGAGPLESPLALENLRSPFYGGLSPDEQATWDEIRFLRRNADAVAYTACCGSGSCFRVTKSLQTPESVCANNGGDKGDCGSGKSPEWQIALDSTLRFGVSLV